SLYHHQTLPGTSATGPGNVWPCSSANFKTARSTCWRLAVQRASRLPCFTATPRATKMAAATERTATRTSKSISVKPGTPWKHGALEPAAESAHLPSLMESGAPIGLRWGLGGRLMALRVSREPGGEVRQIGGGNDQVGLVETGAQVRAARSRGAVARAVHHRRLERALLE